MMQSGHARRRRASHCDHRHGEQLAVGARSRSRQRWSSPASVRRCTSRPSWVSSATSSSLPNAPRLERGASTPDASRRRRSPERLDGRLRSLGRHTPLRKATVSARPSSRWVHGFHAMRAGRRPDVERDPAQLPGGSGAELGLLVVADDVGEQPVEVVHARLQAGADVHELARASIHRLDERVRHVVDEHVVARLVPVAEDRDRLAGQHPLTRRSRSRPPRRGGPAGGRTRCPAPAPCSRGRGSAGRTRGSR